MLVKILAANFKPSMRFCTKACELTSIIKKSHFFCVASCKYSKVFKIGEVVKDFSSICSSLIKAPRVPQSPHLKPKSSKIE